MRFCALCCYIEATTATNKRLKIIIMSQNTFHKINETTVEIRSGISSFERINVMNMKTIGGNCTHIESIRVKAALKFFSL